ncbi:hypothetical protein CCACVL1_04901 [Corchorus capsularis]|uniref:Uncharacterized protein n=1 Tax=Corchorus capsularis TaxID=210143 RepID=A0A1R3JNU2_COCAP|nr:hypothetical protein CCACVL1_04901 [Corchorus capsularis]
MDTRIGPPPGIVIQFIRSGSRFFCGPGTCSG